MFLFSRSHFFVSPYFFGCPFDVISLADLSRTFCVWYSFLCLTLRVQYIASSTGVLEIWARSMLADSSAASRHAHVPFPGSPAPSQPPRHARHSRSHSLDLMTSFRSPPRMASRGSVPHQLGAEASPILNADDSDDSVLTQATSMNAIPTPIYRFTRLFSARAHQVRYMCKQLFELSSKPGQACC